MRGIQTHSYISTFLISTDMKIVVKKLNFNNADENRRILREVEL